MRMLHAASKYTSKLSDLKQIYTSFIRSKLDHSSVVWHSRITKKNAEELERVQKSAVKIILKNKYQDYQKSLKYLNIDELSTRRDKFNLKFAKGCLKNPKVNNFFPLKTNMKATRRANKYKINFANNERYKKSTIPSMQRILNNHERENNEMTSVPVKYDLLSNSLSL